MPSTPSFASSNPADDGAAHDAELPGADALYDEAACALLVTAADGTILRVNGTFCRWLGFERDEIVGCLKLQDLLTMGGRIFHQTHWAPLLQMQGSVAEVKLEVVHRDGHAVPMMMNAAVRRGGARVLHDVAIFSAKDRHRYERELLAARTRAEDLLVQEQAAQRALAAAQEQLRLEHARAEDRALFAEQMIGIVSHDLRNPLSAIQMSTHLLTRADPSASQLRVLERLGNSTARANRLIADLLDFTQARLGQGLKVVRKPVDLHALVSDSVEELGLAYPGRVLQHHRQGAGSCNADGDRLVQLVGNLVSNAMAYGAPGRPVVVRSVLEPGACAIAVHNEGTPIPEAVRERLFEPMTRGHDAGAGARSVGLGLYIVRAIARAHGGDVAVTSSEATGTTFLVRMPLEPDGR